MQVEAIHKNENLSPLKKLDLREGEEVDIEIRKSVADRTFGVIKLEHEVIEEIIETTEYGSW